MASSSGAVLLGALWLLACVTSTGSLSCSSLPPADAPDASLRRQDRCSGRRASIYRQGRDGAGIGFIPAQVFAEPRLQRAICCRSSEVGTPGTWRRRRCAASWCCSGNTKASVKAEEQSLAAAQSPPSPADDATAVPKAVLEPIEWEDSWLDRALHRILKERVDAAIGKRSGNSGPKLGAGRGAHATAAKARLLPLGGHQGGHDEYDAFIRAALQLSRMPAADTRARTLALLYELFPPWFVPSFRTFLSWWPMWFDARHAAASSVLLTGWLVGPSSIVDVDTDQLDADTGRRTGWGNEPSGWVPGFAIGGRWRKELGAGQGVKIERCRVLESSGCAALCANVCKGPTQEFFTEGVGLPLTMVPDFETMSCTFVFGATPPPLELDDVARQPCLATCALGGDVLKLDGGRGLASASACSSSAMSKEQLEAEVEHRLQMWRESSLAADACRRISDPDPESQA